MKKALLLSFLTFIISISNVSAQQLSYEEASKSSTPMVLLIYADWAEDLDSVMNSFQTQASYFSDKYNFVQLNIASEETKAYNKKFHIYPNLPYVILSKDNGKITRYLQKSCVNEPSCFQEKLKFFIN